MIPAQGAQLSVSNDAIQIHYSSLLTALRGSDVEIDLARVTDVTINHPTTLTAGTVHLAGVDLDVVFAPNQDTAARDFHDAVEAALRGEATSVRQVPGLDFIGLDVETANDDWGSICQIGVVRFVDGVEVESRTWLCTPPPGLEQFEDANIAIHGITPEDVAGQPSFAERLPELLEFLGDTPFVAHFAQFDATALHRACAAAGLASPPLYFGCSLTLARGEKLGLRSHSLPVVAEHLGVELVNHHDATEDARACAGITVELARRNDFRGSLPELFHTRSLTLGSLNDDRVYPVLRDRSGAGVALQQRKLAKGLATASAMLAEDTPEETSATAEPELSEDQVMAEAKPSGGRRRGPAPWAAVATPDKVPEPNEAADPDGILFGQNVTLSGDFEPYEKGHLWSAIAERGATVGKNVTRKTTILVAGTWATKTSKQKRAEELIDKGQDIAIWTAEELYAAIGFDEEPPF